MDENEKEVDLKLKTDFKTKQFYKTGLVWFNERIKTDFKKKKVLQELPCRKHNVVFSIASSYGNEENIFGQNKEILKSEFVPQKKDVKVSQIEKHVILKALQKNDFYDFSKIVNYIPEINSIDELVEKDSYLAGFSITLEGRKDDLNNLNNQVYFNALLKLLSTIEKEIKTDISEFQGTENFIPASFKEVFGDKKIKVRIGSERSNSEWDYLRDKDWYVFDSLYGTSEEKSFIDLISRMIEDLRKKYQEIYLVRNERVLKIYDFYDGSAFEPDYILFMKDKEGKDLNYQLFVEPKGTHLLEHDQWKDEFLKKITDKNKTRKPLEYKNKKYKVLGVPFYNHEEENEFKGNLLKIL
jgi:type III restriction enzyme